MFSVLGKYFGAGEPIYRLSVNIHFSEPVTFKGSSLGDSTGLYTPLLLPVWGRITEFAIRNFAGERYVTENGFLLPGLHNGNFKRASLDLVKNCSALIRLENRLQGYGIDNPHNEKVELNFENGEIQYVKAEGGYLYFPLVRENLPAQKPRLAIVSDKKETA
jgi:hypothetical protein